MTDRTSPTIMDPSITQLPANRMENKYEVTAGHEHMTITTNNLGGVSVDFSHDTREMRLPGWEKESAAAFLSDPTVLNLLELKGLNVDAIRREALETKRETPDPWAALNQPSASQPPARRPGPRP